MFSLHRLNNVQNFISSLYPANSSRKNFFLAACICLDEINKSEHSLSAMDLENPYGGLIGPGNSCLEKLFNYSKVLRLHAVIHDACGFMRRKYKVGPGYCYMMPKPLQINSPLLGHVGGIIYCLILKYSDRNYSNLCL